MPHTKITTYLTKNGIEYTITEHPPVFTVEQSSRLRSGTVGAHSKNLFVRDKKKTNYFLISILNHKRVDLKEMAVILGTSKLSFASHDDLMDMLGLIPGSVTPFGLINDEHKKVTFILDDEFMNSQLCNFHPLRNDMTMTVACDDLLLFCRSLGYEPQLLSIPTLD